MYIIIQIFSQSLTDSQSSKCLYIFSEIIDGKTGWDSTLWPCIEPQHFVQRDQHNCGILVLVVRNLNANFCFELTVIGLFFL